MKILGHYNKDTGEEQLLIDHLFNSAEISNKIAKKINFENTVILIGLLHDLGKSDPIFQSYIRGEYKGKDKVHIIV